MNARGLNVTARVIQFAAVGMGLTGKHDKFQIAIYLICIFLQSIMNAEDVIVMVLVIQFEAVACVGRH